MKLQTTSMLAKKTRDENYFNKYNTGRGEKGELIEPINTPNDKFFYYIIAGNIM